MMIINFSAYLNNQQPIFQSFNQFCIKECIDIAGGSTEYHMHVSAVFLLYFFMAVSRFTLAFTAQKWHYLIFGAVDCEMLLPRPCSYLHCFVSPEFFKFSTAFLEKKCNIPFSHNRCCLSLCVCVCVCERERERERESTKSCFVVNMCPWLTCEYVCWLI